MIREEKKRKKTIGRTRKRLLYAKFGRRSDLGLQFGRSAPSRFHGSKLPWFGQMMIRWAPKTLGRYFLPRICVNEGLFEATNLFLPGVTRTVDLS